MRAISSLSLAICKEIDSEEDAMFLADDMLIEDVYVTIKTIDGELIQVEALDWYSEELEISN